MALPVSTPEGNRHTSASSSNITLFFTRVAAVLSRAWCYFISCFSSRGPLNSTRVQQTPLTGTVAEPAARANDAANGVLGGAREQGPIRVDDDPELRRILAPARRAEEEAVARRLVLSDFTTTAHRMLGALPPPSLCIDIEGVQGVLTDLKEGQRALGRRYPGEPMPIGAIGERLEALEAALLTYRQHARDNQRLIAAAPTMNQGTWEQTCRDLQGKKEGVTENQWKNFATCIVESRERGLTQAVEEELKRILSREALAHHPSTIDVDTYRRQSERLNAIMAGQRAALLENSSRLRDLGSTQATILTLSDQITTSEEREELPHLPHEKYDKMGVIRQQYITSLRATRVLGKVDEALFEAQCQTLTRATQFCALALRQRENHWQRIPAGYLAFHAAEERVVATAGQTDAVTMLSENAELQAWVALDQILQKRIQKPDQLEDSMVKFFTHPASSRPNAEKTIRRIVSNVLYNDADRQAITTAAQAEQAQHRHAIAETQIKFETSHIERLRREAELPHLREQLAALRGASRREQAAQCVAYDSGCSAIQQESEQLQESMDRLRPHYDQAMKIRALLATAKPHFELLKALKSGRVRREAGLEALPGGQEAYERAVREIAPSLRREDYP